MTESTPLSESTFLILLSLAPAPRHGYAIMKDVEQMSAGTVRLSTGTLYGAITRLLDQNWIEPVEVTEPLGDRPRKDYRLTDEGRRILMLETRRMESLLTLARMRLQGGEA
ncbi:MAG: helix-turn-helix transcriptional regulator [Anaerolineae bacterium]|nr:helix-turn-helix transcriptional regulator [Anaerolineae bacterium]